MIIAITGGSGSGKTTLARQFSNACHISMDSFWVGKSKMSQPYNFDDPGAVDLARLAAVLRSLKNGESEVEIPEYDMKLMERTGTTSVANKPLVVVEGIFVLLTSDLRELADLKIFLDVPQEERIRRRIQRDTQRGRSLLETLEHSKNVERMHEEHVEPQRQFVDLCWQG